MSKAIALLVLPLALQGEYPSLAACEEARSTMAAGLAERRLCGLGPKRPR